MTEPALSPTLLDPPVQDPPAQDPPAPRPLERPFALGLLWLARVLAGFLIALPVSQVLGASVAQFPEGDRLLFAAGATHLVEATRIHVGALRAAVRTSEWLFVAAAAGQLVPLIVLFSALARSERPSAADLAADAARHLPRFALLSAATTIVQVGALLVLGAPALGLRTALQVRLGVVGADLAAMTAVLVVLLVVGLIGAFQDLVRAALVREPGGLVRAVQVGWRALAARPLLIAIHWLAPVLASATVLVGAELWVLRLDLARPGAWRTIVSFALPQLALFIAVHLRATWLCAALHHVQVVLRKRPQAEPSGALRR